mgnify:CR=1 FL=1
MLRTQKKTKPRERTSTKKEPISPISVFLPLPVFLFRCSVVYYYIYYLIYYFWSIKPENSFSSVPDSVSRWTSLLLVDSSVRVTFFQSESKEEGWIRILIRVLFWLFFFFSRSSPSMFVAYCWQNWKKKREGKHQNADDWNASRAYWRGRAVRFFWRILHFAFCCIRVFCFIYIWIIFVVFN